VRARLIAALAAAAIVPAVCALSALAADPHRTIDASRALDAGALPGAPEFVLTPNPADPPALVERAQWVYDLRWDRGDVWLLGVRRLDLPAPQATPRAMGRFALELFEGPALIERVRFDFPLLGVPDVEDAGAPGAGSAASAAPSITRLLRTRVGVVFPATSRGRRLDLVDRANGRRWSLPWPPPSPSPSPATDAGAGLAAPPGSVPR
jgi:hypothetical protein